MSEPAETARAAIDHDFFGQDALAEAAELSVPPRYRLERRVGRGGFGVVYLATDTTLGRPVALKFLTQAGPSDVERFRREARYAARLTDRAIVRIYEHGECDGQPYIAMEYVDGPSLEDADVDAPTLAGIVRTVALALGQAHAAGIIHRDVKPQNILLDRDGRPRITDFGIARNLQAEAGATLSYEGQIVGTPALMPPEQARGERAAVDARSDVYALGATLFVKLTGRMPFERDTLVDTLHAVLHEPPPFPRSINPAIPRPLEAVTLRCLQKDPRDRYQSMAALAEDLTRFIENRTASGDGAVWFRKLVGAPLVAPRAEPTTDPQMTAVLEVAREISAWDASLYRVSSNLHRTFPALDTAIDRLGQMLTKRPDFALARFYRGLALFRRGRLGEAVEEMERAVDLAGDVPGAHFELGRLYLALFLRDMQHANRHISRHGALHEMKAARGRLDAAVTSFREAQRVEKAEQLWHVDFVRAVERLAVDDFGECVAICNGILARDPDIEEAWKLRGDALSLWGGDPFKSYERATAVRRCYYEAYAAKAEAHLVRGQVPKAREALERALEIWPDYTHGLVLMARVHAAEGRTDEALAVLGRAERLDLMNYDALVDRAELLLETGRAARDLARVDQALEAIQRGYGFPGCQQRVSLIHTRARLERARLLGPDGRAELEALLPDVERLLADHTGEHHHDHTEPWEQLVAEVRREAGK